MKMPVKTEAQPSALDVLINITDQALAFRFGDKTPSLGAIVRMVSTASRTLHIRNLDERIETENSATLALARKHGVVQ
jgi:hypothetical protein